MRRRSRHPGRRARATRRLQSDGGREYQTLGGSLSLELSGQLVDPAPNSRLAAQVEAGHEGKLSLQAQFELPVAAAHAFDRAFEHGDGRGQTSRVARCSFRPIEHCECPLPRIVEPFDRGLERVEALSSAGSQLRHPDLTNPPPPPP